MRYKLNIYYLSLLESKGSELIEVQYCWFKWWAEMLAFSVFLSNRFLAAGMVYAEIEEID